MKGAYVSFCRLTALDVNGGGGGGGGVAQLENQYDLNISCNSLARACVRACVCAPSRVERGPVTPTIFGQ